MKKRSLACITILLLSLMILRIYYINKDVQVPIEKYYDVSEVVPFENDYTRNSDEIINGYTAKVLGAELIPIKEFYKTYLKVEGFSEETFAKYYYIVKVSFGNTTNLEGINTGISLANTSLVGTNYYMVIDSQVFSMLNPDMPGISFSLKLDSEKELLLPYAVVPSTHTDKKGFLKDPPKLQITEYPNRKLLAIS
ncbi:DUF5028 domain-containing protein [uncultured Vagococcus sp.]|uniref:DUF5028 domain-containing protein n=1 Tax=uncultured Vagococcus sp. TaxID=189676 RepID=UPI0028D820DB|nr:DUF5028 domain-containing protein [uncultured Vagococcus sp.]